MYTVPGIRWKPLEKVILVPFGYMDKVNPVWCKLWDHAKFQMGFFLLFRSHRDIFTANEWKTNAINSDITSEKSHEQDYWTYFDRSAACIFPVTNLPFLPAVPVQVNKWWELFLSLLLLLILSSKN